MKYFFNIRYVPAVLFLILSAPIAHAATSTSLGVAASFGVLASTFTNTSASTTVNGDVGYTTGPATAPIIFGTDFGSGAPTPAAKVAANATLTNLNTYPCDFNIGAAPDLSLLSQPLVPGVYCGTGVMSIGAGGITLNGNGTYIFRTAGAFNTVAGSAVTLTGGAYAGDVWWTFGGATTLGANTTFAGNILQTSSAITVGANASWTGRALPTAGTVTTGFGDTISVPHPVVSSINRFSSSPTNSSSLDFTVTFNTTVTGVDTSDFATVLTGSAAGSIASVTPVSGLVYTLTVNGISGNGSLGLNLVDNNTILDAAGNSLGGTGTSTNGNFTGQIYTIDNTVPVIAITPVTLTSSTTISNTTIHVTDDLAIASSTVSVSGTATPSGLSCVQTNATTVDCSVNITASGTLLVNATDAAGNAAVQASQAGYVIETISPVIVITAPLLTSSSTITSTTIHVTDNNAIASSTVSVSGTATPTSLNCVQTNATTTDCTVSITTSGTLSVNARDVAGNAAVQASQAGYVIDTTVPVISITAPTLNSSSTITNTTIRVTDNFSIASSTVSVSGSAAPNTLLCTQTSSTQVDCTVHITASGTLLVDARDAVGNPAVQGSQAGYVIDSTPPTVTIVTPADTRTTKMATPLIVTTSENSSCSYRLDGGSYTAVSNTGNTYHVDNLTGLSSASHTVVLKCLDAVSNIGYATSTWTKLAPGATVLFGIDGAGGNPTPNLYTLNPETGSRIATIGPVGFDVTGLAQDPNSGNLYGSTGGNDFNGHSNSMVQIDPLTGAGTLLGSTAKTFADIEFNASGTLYGWSETGDDLYTIDLSSCNGVSCTVNKVAEFAHSTSGSGLAFDSTGQLYQFGGADNNFNHIDPTTGLRISNMVFVNPSGNNYQLAAATTDPAGLIFVSRINGSSSPTDLIVVDPTNGIIATMGGNNPDMLKMDSIAFYTPTTVPGTPVISPPGQGYSSAQTITITSSSSTSIRYTTDGTTPTCSVGNVYAGPFVLSAPATVNAVGCVSGIVSAVASSSYNIVIGGTGGGSGGGGGGGLAPITSTFQIYYNGQYLTQDQYNALLKNATGTSVQITTPTLTSPTISSGGVLDPSDISILVSALQSQFGKTCDQSTAFLTLSRVYADANEFKLTLTTPQALSIRNFILCGISPATIKFGAGERRAIARDYMETVGRSSFVWSDIERLSTGQIPLERNLTLERKNVSVALPVFRKLFGHDPDFKNGTENLAWNTLLYRIRFPRDLVKETKGIRAYIALYSHNPTSPFGWSVVRVLGYVK